MHTPNFSKIILFTLLINGSSFAFSSICNSLLGVTSASPGSKKEILVPTKKNLKQSLEALPGSWNENVGGQIIFGQKLLDLIIILKADLSSYGEFSILNLERISKGAIPGLAFSPDAIAKGLADLKSPNQNKALLDVLDILAETSFHWEVLGAEGPYKQSPEFKRYKERVDYLRKYFEEQNLVTLRAKELKGLSVELMVKYFVSNIKKPVSIKNLKQSLEALPKTWNRKKDGEIVFGQKLLDLILLLQSDLSIYGDFSILSLNRISKNEIPGLALSPATIAKGLAELKKSGEYKHLLVILDLIIEAKLYWELLGAEGYYKQSPELTLFEESIESLREYFKLPEEKAKNTGVSRGQWG